jgi:hypothetical protein
MKKLRNTNMPYEPETNFVSDDDHSNAKNRRRLDAVSLSFGLFFVLAGISFLNDRSDSFAERLGRLLPVVLVVLGAAMLLSGRKKEKDKHR